jgi:hypothetical protein
VLKKKEKIIYSKEARGRLKIDYTGGIHGK